MALYSTVLPVRDITLRKPIVASVGSPPKAIPANQLSWRLAADRFAIKGVVVSLQLDRTEAEGLSEVL